MTDDPKTELYKKLAREYRLDVRTVKRRLYEGIPLDAQLKKGSTKYSQVGVHLAKEDRELMEQRAKESGLSLSAYIRGMLRLD